MFILGLTNAFSKYGKNKYENKNIQYLQYVFSFLENDAIGDGSSFFLWKNEWQFQFCPKLCIFATNHLMG